MTGHDRGVSTAVNYVLTLGITTILISGLLIATGGVVDDRREATTHDALGVTGQRLAANLMSADRLAQTAGARSVAVEVTLPERIGGSGYVLRIHGASSTIVLESEGADVSRRVQFVATTPVATTELRGGALRIVLTPSGQLEVQSA